MARPVAAGGATLHFVDDRAETLEAIVQQAPDVAERCGRGGWSVRARQGSVGHGPSRRAAAAVCMPPGNRQCDVPPRTACPSLLSCRYQLYLADWGYCSAADLAAAAALPGVRRLSLPGFLELLRWGVVMGVDDGCEPTPEEVEAAAREG